jgi:hypothetical protein
MSWDSLLVLSLATNGVIVFSYRVWRLTQGGPTYDVIGGAILAGALGGIAAGHAAGAEWLRWAALAYALLFGLVVMPVWTLAVLIPMRPGAVDLSFTAVYWGSLVVIAVAAVVA